MEIWDRIADVAPLKLVLDMVLIVGGFYALEKFPFAKSVVRYLLHMDKEEPK